ncbi:MAG: hypothetical protein COB54_07300 [Alphaproteobacteria bacterium]|nr:MAG: hypothetical protein COB54_07300 [Alphaproteobacteria bacterium]
MKKAANFSATLHTGDNFELSSLTGKKIWLAFFRYSGCPLCNLRVNQIIKRKEEFNKLNIQVVAVFQSDRENTAKYVGKQDIYFPLICDPEQDLYKLYGVSSSVSGLFSMDAMSKLYKALKNGFLPGIPSGDMTRIPADFLIDEDFNIAFEFHGKDIGDHIPFDKVLNWGTAKK